MSTAVKGVDVRVCPDPSCILYPTPSEKYLGINNGDQGHLYLTPLPESPASGCCAGDGLKGVMLVVRKSIQGPSSAERMTT